MSKKVKLLGYWSSPYSRRVETVLKLKGIPYEYIEEDIYDKSPFLLKHNPVFKCVPVLIYNGKPISETLVILDFIDENWKQNPVLPTDPYEKAVARFWANFISHKCGPTLRVCFSQGIGSEKAMEEAHECLKVLEEELKDKKFFGGETIGYVDIIANTIGYWVEVFHEASGVEIITLDKFPRLYNWTKNFVDHKDMKENLPPRDKLVAYFKAKPWIPKVTST